MSDPQLGVTLLCFATEAGASQARQPFEKQLRSAGDVVLQTTVLKVSGKGQASVFDARRVLRGTLTAALTWGAFGLVAGSNRVESTILWAVIGAICGGLYAYFAEHLITKSELQAIATRLGPRTSALVAFVQTVDPARLLQGSGSFGPSSASIATIGSDLSARVLSGVGTTIELSASTPGTRLNIDRSALLSMVVVRYPDPRVAGQVASQAAKSVGAPGTPQIELVIETDPGGRRRVSDPSHGVEAWAKSDTVSWGLFGLVYGAIVGFLGGGGLFGLFETGIATGIGWAVFGVVAGALYGLWAGRSITAGQLRGIGPLLPNSSSALLAWADGPVEADTLKTLTAPGSERLVLGFNPVEGGALLEAS